MLYIQYLSHLILKQIRTYQQQQQHGSRYSYYAYFHVREPWLGKSRELVAGPTAWKI